MDKTEINIGDLVKLKSGGQEMIVSKYYWDSKKWDKTRVHCCWHDLLGNPQDYVYPLNSLLKV